MRVQRHGHTERVIADAEVRTRSGNSDLDHGALLLEDETHLTILSGAVLKA